MNPHNNLPRTNFSVPPVHLRFLLDSHSKKARKKKKKREDSHRCHDGLGHGVIPEVTHASLTQSVVHLGDKGLVNAIYKAGFFIEFQTLLLFSIQ